jgi:hypothetical protein
MCLWEGRRGRKDPGSIPGTGIIFWTPIADRETMEPEPGNEVSFTTPFTGAVKGIVIRVDPPYVTVQVEGAMVTILRERVTVKEEG